MAAVVYAEVCSSLVHLIADNPAFLDVPFFGPLADGFQSHHEDPSGIAQLDWFDFLTKIDVGMLVLVGFAYVHGRLWRSQLGVFAVVSVPLM